MICDNEIGESIMKKTANYLIKPSDSVSCVSYDEKYGKKLLAEKKECVLHDILKMENSN